MALHAHKSKGIGLLVKIITRVLIGLMIAALAVIAVVVVGPRFLPYQALVVRSGSMSPAIPTGSVAFYRKEPSTEVRVGQVILFAEPGDPTIHITHRVVQIVSSSTGTYFVTKGDANAGPDDWRVPATGTGWYVVYHVPYLGYAIADLSGEWFHWILLGLPAFALAAIFLYELLRADRAPPEPEAA